MANNNKKMSVKKQVVPQKKSGRMTNPSGQTIVGSVNRPRFQSVNGSDLRITNTELLFPMTTLASPNTSFSQNIPLNPASSNQFGWLAPIAKNFNKYRFENLVISYVSRVATTRDGAVGLGVFYDYESSQSWKVGSSSVSDALTRLSYCSEFNTCPIYAGGNIGNPRDPDFVVVVAKTGPQSRRLNWFTIDSDPASPTSEASSKFNLSVQNFIGVVCEFSLSLSTVGYLYVTYDIVLSECACPFTPLPLTLGQGVSGIFDPKPFPPLPDIPQAPSEPKPKPPVSDPKNEAEELHT